MIDALIKLYTLLLPLYTRTCQNVLRPMSVARGTAHHAHRASHGP